MKISFGVSMLIFLALVFSGCATGSCKKNTGCTNCSGAYIPPAEGVQVQAAPAAPAPVVSAPAVDLAEEEVPAAVRKYVSK